MTPKLLEPLGYWRLTKRQLWHQAAAHIVRPNKEKIGLCGT
jgi:hypothetical protein